MLPLKERVTEHNPIFRLVHDAPRLIPQRKPAPGEQYRFHFDATKCIGCHCCEVACSEQNSLPADIQWRRVGEVEGGVYPRTERLHLSMGCNHCLEPACLIGCPVEAYRKDDAMGLVLHDADACIGCQYCVWNCPYGVPQFNPERGVVGKCDMCHGRLESGEAPACVNACPEEAITVEVVNQAQWLESYETSANAPGLPAARETVSTTRVTLPENLPDMRKADYDRIRLEHSHLPLVVMTVLTQLSAGSFLAQWVDASRGVESPRLANALMSLVCGLVALVVSTLHLGRPIYAYRALRMWRRSWLSREVLLFSLFAGAASSYAFAIWRGFHVAYDLLGPATVLLGFAGVAASAWIYLVPARPAWRMVHTPVEFFLTCALTGSMVRLATTHAPFWMSATVAAALLQGANFAIKLWRLRASAEYELHASSLLLARDLRGWVVLRLALLFFGPMLLGNVWLGLAAVVAGEFVSRYLFFVSVVPRNIASMFIRPGGGTH